MMLYTNKSKTTKIKRTYMHTKRTSKSHCTYMRTNAHTYTQTHKHSPMSQKIDENTKYKIQNNCKHTTCHVPMDVSSPF